jgi:hypothetical protein
VAKLLKKLSLNFSEYILDKSIKNKDNSYELKYIHKYQDYLIYDDYISAVVGNSGIKRLEYKYREVKILEQNSGQDLLEAYQILIGASDIKDTEIEGIDMGFKKGKTDEETRNSFEVPVWRIKLGNSEIFYEASKEQSLIFRKIIFSL